MNDPFDLDNLPVFDDAPSATEENIPPPYLEGLNDPQAEAVLTLEGLYLCLLAREQGKPAY